MTEVTSQMVALGTPAPAFSLPSTDNTTVSLADFKGAPALVVIFMCNHCPFVQHVAPKLAEVSAKYQQQEVAFVGISSTDVQQVPADDVPQMNQFKQQHNLPFPYLYDESQAVAQAYKAACTPDIFVYDQDQKLIYRGQFDDSRPGKGEATGNDLTQVLDALLNGQPVPTDQKPSSGCNIKWQPGNEPEYF